MQETTPETLGQTLVSGITAIFSHVQAGRLKVGEEGVGLGGWIHPRPTHKTH